MGGQIRVKSAGSAKEDLTPRLIARFKSMMSDGQLEPGCKLPAERDLAARLGVSRSSLRPALKVLEIMGVINQRVGDGTYLNKTAGAIMSEPLDFLVLLDGIAHHELFEARMIVEPELAARAAKRATAEDLSEMRRQLKALEKSGLSLEKVIAADLAFHESIIHAAGNRVCESIFSVIHRALLASMAQNSDREDKKRTLEYHTAIYRAIEKRRPAEARRKMTEHISQARDLLLKAPHRPRVPKTLSIEPLRDVSRPAPNLG